MPVDFLESPTITLCKDTTIAEILKINLHKIAENLTFLSRLAENLIIQTIINAQILTIMAYEKGLAIAKPSINILSF